MEAKRLTRGAGILMAITSLPSDYGIGTLGDAAFNFVDLLVDLKQRYWQILPIGPTSFGDSPYQSISAFAGNPYFIDFETLKREGLIKKSDYEDIKWQDNDHQVNYSIIYNNCFKVLRQAYKTYKRDISKRYKTFVEKNSSWLDDYALFMALKFKNNGKNEYYNSHSNRADVRRGNSASSKHQRQDSTQSYSSRQAKSRKFRYTHDQDLFARPS